MRNLTEINETKEEALKRVRAALLNILEDTEDARKEAVYEKNKTSAIIENLTDGVMLLDNDYRIKIINQAAFDLLKKDKKRIENVNIFDFLCNKELDPLCTAMKDESNRIKILKSKEVRLREKIYFELTTVFLKTESEDKGILVIMHDISRDKLIESLKTEFVSIAAHQLRTPLSSIKWTISMILNGDVGPVNEEQRDFLKKTYESNERMIALINDLLNVSRIEEGRFLYKQEPIQMEDLVKNIINSEAELISLRKIKLEFNIPSMPLPKVYIDKEKMGLVVQNLLENSIRYTGEGGTIEISLQKKDNNIVFEIKDSGVGIPKSQYNRVFNKFFRGENVMKMETEGTGLGLYVSKNIVEAHKGKIWFESEENKGTTFFFQIPSIKEKKEECIVA